MDKQIELLQQQLKKQEKLASLGLLSAGIAHEIQNPLNFVINFSKISEKLLKDLLEILKDNIDLLPEEDSEEVEDIISDLQENMDKIKEHGERAISIIQGILLISRGKENEFIPSDINKIVKEYVWLAYHALRANHKGFNIAIHEDYQNDLPQMMVIPQDLSRAVLNLVNNACYTVWSKAQKEGEDYMPTINVESRLTDDNMLSVTITDNGEGMSEEVSSHIFDNFFTTKPVGHGTGLGMGIIRDIIENKHNGKLTFKTEEGKGTSFTFVIPVKKS